MIIEVAGKIFHMHIHADTEDGPMEIIADVALEPSMGLLIIAAGDLAVSKSWPHRDQWGTKTFEEFLCSRTPSWIASKMLGDNAMIFDEESTKETLLEACGSKFIADISNLVENINSHGMIIPSGQNIADSLQDVLPESLDSYIMMTSTGFAEFLIEGVLPALLERIAPPPVVKDQADLKLC